MQSNEPALDLITQGVTLMKLQKYSDACDMFRLALEQDPENFDAYIHLGNAYVNLNELNEAITAFKSALILDKDSGQALFSLANVYYLLDDNKNAIKNYVKAENVGYHSADMYVIMGNIFYSAGDTVQALRYVSRAVKEQPLRGDLWRQKILLELELEHVDAALETLDEFESILPEALDIHELRTRILLDLKRYDEAREYLAKALLVFPDDMRLRLLKIQLEIADEHPEAAKEEIVQIKSQGLDAGFRKKIAMEEADIYLREGNLAGIVDSLSWGLEESPGDADLLFIMLNTYIAVLDYDNIIKFADQLLKNEEIDPSAMASAEFYRALSLRQTGKEEEAVAEFKRLTRSLRKLSIDNPESIDIFIYRLLTHNALKEYDKAFELADYLGKVSPDEASVHAFRSLIYKDMGEQENAAAELEMAKRLNPNIKG